MKIIYKNYQAGDLKVQVQNLDDLWYLSHIIYKGDIVKGHTFRKLKIGQEPNVKVVKKKIFLEIEVEKIEFHKYTDSLRVSGKVRGNSEDVAKGNYHTFDVNENTIIKIHKEKWYNYQIEKVTEASKNFDSKILICVLDREDACFALMKKYGYDFLSSLKGDVRKKGDEEKKKESHFYTDIYKQLKMYVERYNLENIIIASPAFWKEELMKVIKKKDSSMLKMISLATCNNVGNNGINEVLKRDEVRTVLDQDRAVKEIKLVEELLKQISIEGKYAYGFKEVKKVVEAGAVEILLISEKMMQKYREEENYDLLDELMKKVDNTNGKIHIISFDHDGGKKLESLGGIGAILRYKMNY